MIDVYVVDCAFGGINHYIVMVDGKKYDEFVSSKRLTWSEQVDVGNSYREGLDGYQSAMLP